MAAQERWLCKLKGLLVFTQVILTSLKLSTKVLSSLHFGVQAATGSQIKHAERNDFKATRFDPQRNICRCCLERHYSCLVRTGADKPTQLMP
jgi:hypothetical protein